MSVFSPILTASAIPLLGVGLLLLCSFALFPYNVSRQGRMPSALQLPQTLLLAAWTLIMWLTATRETPFWILGICLSGGIAFGFVGDLFMANTFRQQNHVLFGMGAFATGHVLYMLGFRQLALAFELHAAGAHVLALLALWLVAFVVWRRVIRTPDGDVMQVAALIYALFLATMAAYAVGLALQHSAFWPLAAGALLFLLSDILIAARLFAGRSFRYMGDLIWFTYAAAQMLIVTVLPVALAL